MPKVCLITSAIAVAAIAIAGLATPAMAEAQATRTLICPASYAPWNGLCFDRASGDVVLGRTAAAAAAFTNANCDAGYEIAFETLCISKTTGDVVLARNASVDVIQAAKK